MLNYEVDRKLVSGYIPPGTVLDSFEGRTYVSLVGFRFRHTKLFGFLPIPFHADFDEVNLRLYVRRNKGNESRRGVVFIAEIVPKRAVAQIARVAYGENYVRLPMGHSISTNAFEYRFQLNNSWCKLHARSSVAPRPAVEGSLEQFITEHYWGYSAQRDGSALEYHVSHVPWNVGVSTAAGFEGDASRVYGVELAKVLQRRPDSAFIADGSPITVFGGKRIH
jgi:uncharacterized protein YqjF (DUF2071 family)